MLTNINQFYRVIRKQFILNMSQKEIAESEGLSTATVCRMLKQAVSEGYVSYMVHIPTRSDPVLEKEIKELFHLQYVCVVDPEPFDQIAIERDIGNAVAEFLNETLKQGDVLGVAWGKTIDVISSYLIPKDVPGLKIVSILGNTSPTKGLLASETTFSKFAKNFNGTKVCFFLPAILDSLEAISLLKKDSNVKEIAELIEQADTVLCSIGLLTEENPLVQSGLISKQAYKSLKEQGYVGDVCGRQIKPDGSHQTGEDYERVLGISLEEIKRKEKRIGVVINPEKAVALYGALRGEYLTHLFIDKRTAEELLKLV